MYSKTSEASSRRVGHQRRWTSCFLSVAKKLSAPAFERVTLGAHRDRDAGVAGGLAEAQRHVLGGFTPSLRRHVGAKARTRPAGASASDDEQARRARLLLAAEAVA